MPKYHVKRSIIIDAPIATVRSSLTDFKQWPAWSPWLIMEPSAKLEYNDKQGQQGAFYRWSGELVGSGDMELQEIRDSRLDMQLNFLKPFKSQARVSFDIKQQGDSTKVTWHMYGSLPFFLFFMTKKMSYCIGMDYERGLKMLKDYLETGQVASSVDIKGIQTIPTQKYIGLKNECSLDDMENVMPKDFGKLQTLVEEKQLSINQAPFAIYNVFDMEKQHTSFVSAIPIDTDIVVPAPFFIGELASCEVIKVTHTGKYQHLGNAWSAAMSYSRYNKIKTTKEPMGIERYINDPASTEENQLISEVLLPL